LKGFLLLGEKEQLGRLKGNKLQVLVWKQSSGKGYERSLFAHTLTTYCISTSDHDIEHLVSEKDGI
jgi:hypothetical protein